MFFHTSNFTYLTYFNDEIIVLNLYKNQYIILRKALAKVLYFALKNEFRLLNDNYILSTNAKSKNLSSTLFNKSIRFLRKLNILDSKDYDYPCSILLKKKKFSSGMENIDWRMSYGILNDKVSKKLVLEAYFTLLKVNVILKIGGFYRLIKKIKKEKLRNIKYTLQNHDADHFNTLTTALNKACFFYPTKTKCLEWSATLVLMALRRRWKCCLVIGVQNLPFIAHAWVESNDTVIADSRELPQNLSVILSEPS